MPSRTEETLAMVTYVGAIVLGLILLGQLVPLFIYLARGRVSPFIRFHAAQALNVTLTFPFYALSIAIAALMLSFANTIAAIALGVSIFVIGWAITMRYLVRGASAAEHGEVTDVPRWLCTQFVR